MIKVSAIVLAIIVILFLGLLMMPGVPKFPVIALVFLLLGTWLLGYLIYRLILWIKKRG